MIDSTRSPMDRRGFFIAVASCGALLLSASGPSTGFCGGGTYIVRDCEFAAFKKPSSEPMGAFSDSTNTQSPSRSTVVLGGIVTT